MTKEEINEKGSRERAIIDFGIQYWMTDSEEELKPYVDEYTASGVIDQKLEERCLKAQTSSKKCKMLSLH